MGNLILEYPHQLLQNIKNTSFYTFWSKNTHFSGCKIVYKCTSVTITVHICIVIVTFTFNILVFFFFYLFVSGCSHSHLTLPFSHLIKSLEWQDHWTTCHPWSLATATDLSSIATKPLLSLITFLCFSLFDQWVSSWVDDDLAFLCFSLFLVVWSVGFLVEGFISPDWMGWLSLMMVVRWVMIIGSVGFVRERGSE